MAVGDRVSNSNRVESFSDAVFAIAITLLVLDLSVPRNAATFLSNLAGQWPSYLAFLASFAILGLIWLSHHDLFSRLQGVNASLLLRNLLLLFLAALFTFPTAVLAASFRAGGTRTNQLAAITIFDSTAVAITLAWAYLARVPVVAPHLASDPVETARYAHAQIVFARIACALLGTAFAVGFLSTVASIMLITVLPLINIAFYRRAQRKSPPPGDAPPS